MTEDDRTWNTRLTKTARKTKEQKKNPYSGLWGSILSWYAPIRCKSLGGSTLARNCFSLGASVG